MKKPDLAYRIEVSAELESARRKAPTMSEDILDLRLGREVEGEYAVFHLSAAREGCSIRIASWTWSSGDRTCDRVGPDCVSQVYDDRL